MLRLNLFLLLLIIISPDLTGQNQECIAFYNVENLFDTVDDTLIRDEEYLPSNGWTEDRYHDKIEKMATVIDQLGKVKSIDGPSFIGLSEVENKKVLEDLIAHPLLSDEGFQILHVNSPDRRGIDVAAIYKKDRFVPLSFKAFELPIYKDDGSKKYTRDILYISGLLQGEMVHLTVNHWPSRSGGQKVSGPYRQLAGKINRQLYDSLRTNQPDVKFIVLGDLNDNPNDKSIKDELNARKKLKNGSDEMYNPFCKYYSKGIGSNAWRDTWSNFDQIILSSSFSPSNSGWKYDKAQVFKKPFMLRKSGKWKNYPLRTQVGGQYLGGYSDHFPVLVYLKQ